MFFFFLITFIYSKIKSFDYSGENSILQRLYCLPFKGLMEKFLSSDVQTIYFLFAKVDLDEILQGCTYQGIQRILGVLIPEIIGNNFLIKNTLDQSVFTFVIQIYIYIYQRTQRAQKREDKETQRGQRTISALFSLYI